MSIFRYGRFLISACCLFFSTLSAVQSQPEEIGANASNEVFYEFSCTNEKSYIVNNNDVKDMLRKKCPYTKNIK